MSVVTRKWPIVAIDGPAGAGKSTVSTRVAQELGYHLLDTGAIYRSVALCALRDNVVGRPDAVAELASQLAESKAIRFEEDGARTRVFIRDEEVTELIRTPEVSTAASVTSSIPGVRRSLLDIQRQFGVDGRVVVEGRDIGSVVFPDAEAKFFLTASTHARAKRRYSELAQRGAAVSLQEVESEVIERDRRDSTRPIAPLIQASDAVVVDSTERSIDEVVGFIVEHVRTVEAKLAANDSGHRTGQ
jgi:cytidylate kinase